MEVSFSKEVSAAAPRRRRGLPRRGHPRHHQGAAAVGRVVRRRLPGRAGVAPARRHGAGRAVHEGARRPRRGLRQRGLGGGDARRLDPLPAARRGDVEVDRRHQRRRRRALEPLVARRDRRRADRRRRGLRRRRERDPGAHPRLRAEVVDADARPAARARPHGAHGRARVSAVGSVEHAGDARAAHPRLPRARQLRLQGQRRAARSRRAAAAPSRRASTTRASPIRRSPSATRS